MRRGGKVQTGMRMRRFAMFYNGKDMIIKHEAIKPIEFDKLKIIDYTAGQENSSSFAEITVPTGVSHKLSWSNRSDKYYYVVKGKVNFTVNEESNNLSSGDVCIIPKGKRFSYMNTNSSEAILILVHTPSFKLECEEFEE
ncbi:MAG: cupin domain-containing protein [Deltaproteobacteria bacterium]|uniref:Cupin domain-containing protein n=1 Tax=Candidatus Zymogenus saltonus TaxID=2844893 RepID=A0A9D8KCW2_9DELT|nr:cupin domain-containing protein [Candidatus Zymogenus saltonus]